MKYTYTIILSLLIIKGLFAQDIHFTNYQNYIALHNAALVSQNYKGTSISGIYRSQWSAIPKPYSSYQVAIEHRKNNLAFGGFINRNSTVLTTTNAVANLALYKPLNKRNSTLSIGAQIGVSQRSLNTNGLTFDAQYDASQGYNPNLSSGENFNSNNKSMIDMGVGLNWNGNILKQNSNIGFSLQHINSPNESLNDQSNVNLPRKFTFYSNINLKLKKQLLLSPNVLYQSQGTHQVTVLGVTAQKELSENKKVSFGVASRLKDAILLQAGIQLSRYSFSIGYDINTSSLSRATNGNGAIEFAAKIYLNTKKDEPLVDSDGDGIYDIEDDCPTVPGVKSLKGCPIPPKKTTPIVAAPLDSDKDTVLDSLDDCPFIFGFVHLKGCPDSDKDGISDNQDECPELFGYLENKGCPIKNNDSDRDGIPDHQDYCPYLKGLETLKGCPDSDKDGISDIDDHCPYLKGTKSNNGCPSRQSQADVESLMNIVVEFDTDKSFIKPEFKIQLDEIVSFTQALDKGTYKIIISGHTDNEGNDAYNYELGQRRAMAVQSYLMQRGVVDFEFSMISYGENLPRRENSSYIGKARNRRAEVYVIPVNSK